MGSPKEEEFLQVLAGCHERLWRFALSMTRSHVDAEDLYSDTVLAAYERFHTVRDRKAFVSFLFTIATRIQHTNRRKKARYAEWDAAIAEELESPEAGPDQAAELRLIRDALAELPKKVRDTIVLFEVTGFSIEEIREIQGGTISGVKSRLRRGRKQLGQLLGLSHDEEGQSDARIDHRFRSQELRLLVGATQQ